MLWLKIVCMGPTCQAGQPCNLVTQGKQGGLEGSFSRACALVLGAADEVHPLAVVLSPSLSRS
jgi:hypothetical protein